MKFPYKPAAVFTKHGATVVEIQGIGHKLDKPQSGYSRDYWFYRAQVRWEDGKLGEPNRHLFPYDLCSDSPEGFAEINAMSEAMMDYLRNHGEWCEKGKHEGWYANRKERSAA